MMSPGQPKALRRGPLPGCRRVLQSPSMNKHTALLAAAVAVLAVACSKTTVIVPAETTEVEAAPAVITAAPVSVPPVQVPPLIARPTVSVPPIAVPPLIAAPAAEPCDGLAVDVFMLPAAVAVNFRTVPPGSVTEHEGTLTGSHRVLDCLADKLAAPAMRARLASFDADPDVTVTAHDGHDVIDGLSPLQPYDDSFYWPPAQAKAILDAYDAHSH